MYETSPIAATKKYCGWFLTAKPIANSPGSLGKRLAEFISITNAIATQTSTNCPSEGFSKIELK